MNKVMQSTIPLPVSEKKEKKSNRKMIQAEVDVDLLKELYRVRKQTTAPDETPPTRRSILEWGIRAWCAARLAKKQS